MWDFLRIFSDFFYLICQPLFKPETQETTIKKVCEVNVFMFINKLVNNTSNKPHLVTGDWCRRHDETWRVKHNHGTIDGHFYKSKRKSKKEIKYLFIQLIFCPFASLLFQIAKKIGFRTSNNKKKSQLVV